MKTEQTIHLEKIQQHSFSEFQVARKSGQAGLKSTDKIKPEKTTFNDLRGLSWIILEEYS